MAKPTKEKINEMGQVMRGSGKLCSLTVQKRYPANRIRRQVDVHRVGHQVLEVNGSVDYSAKKKVEEEMIEGEHQRQA